MTSPPATPLQASRQRYRAASFRDDPQHHCYIFVWDETLAGYIQNDQPFTQVDVITELARLRGQTQTGGDHDVA